MPKANPVLDENVGRAPMREHPSLDKVEYDYVIMAGFCEATFKAVEITYVDDRVVSWRPTQRNDGC